MRLIDADALKEDLRQYYPDSVLEGVTAKATFNQILQDINNAPTVELQMGRMTNGIIIPIERPTGEYQKRALELINTLEDEHKITVRQVGTLRRAILAEPDRPTGEWVEELTLDRWVQELPSVYYCSRCRSEPFGDNLYHYCPNCGAKMKGAEEGHDTDDEKADSGLLEEE